MATAQSRRDLIAQFVEEYERVSVVDLISRFNVTDTSIRHDLIVLEEEGRLRRVRGGAESRGRFRNGGTYAARARVNRVEKGRIGAVAAELIHAGDVVFLDSGSTVAQVAAHVAAPLRRSNAITVVTHSQSVIEEVGVWEQPHLVSLGGIYLPDYRAMVGPTTLTELRDLSADVVFLGCDGLTLESGLSTPHMLIAEVGAAMASRGRRVVAVADATKLGRVGFTPIVPLADVNLVVTDQGADPGLLDAIRSLGIEVLLA